MSEIYSSEKFGTVRELAKALKTTESVAVYAARKVGIPIYLYEDYLTNENFLAAIEDRTAKYAKGGRGSLRTMTPEARIQRARNANKSKTAKNKVLKSNSS